MRRFVLFFLLVLSVCILVPAVAVAADGPPDPAEAFAPAAAADPAVRPYDSYTPYSEIDDVLADLDAHSDRLSYEVVGRSAGGRDLWLVTVADPSLGPDYGLWGEIRDLMTTDPAAAQDLLDAARPADLRVPVFINASIHGDETPGVDAALRMLRHLALDDDDEVRSILASCILVVNVCQNPDGRVAHTRSNANGFDLNRDFATLSQPETQITAAAIDRWKPVTLLDLHGFYNPMLIEPCTPPHNPNYEYDLFIKWALDEGLAMRDGVESATQFKVQIPYLDWTSGWEDYGLIYTPQFAMHHGAIGLTLETVSETEAGVECHYQASMAATRFVAANKVGLLRDQLEIFRRGCEAVPQDDIDMAAAWVVPAGGELQRSPTQAARLVGNLLLSGVDVKRAGSSFIAGNVLYPAGTFVVPLDQAMRGLANNLLWDGEDLSATVSSMYDICAWSLPRLWGCTATPLDAPVTAALVDVTEPPLAPGGVLGEGSRYALDNDSNAAVRAVNAMLREGLDVFVDPDEDGDEVAAGDFVVVANHNAVADVAERFRVTFEPCDVQDHGLKRLHPAKVAVSAPADVLFALRSLGFDAAPLAADDSLTGYDALVGADAGLAGTPVKQYVKDGGSYIGVGVRGMSGFLGRLLPVKWAAGGAADNGIVRLDFSQGSVTAAGYTADDFAYVYKPVWFTDLGDGVSVVASYDADPFLAGFWPGSEAAANAPVIVCGEYGDGEVVLMGVRPAFRAHPEHTFRLLANAIYASQ
jgi:predicted deacylase